jgi:hypothetical protein
MAHISDFVKGKKGKKLKNLKKYAPKADKKISGAVSFNQTVRSGIRRDVQAHRLFYTRSIRVL